MRSASDAPSSRAAKPVDGGVAPEGDVAGDGDSGAMDSGTMIEPTVILKDRSGPRRVCRQKKRQCHLTDRASTCHRYAFVTLAKHEVSDRNAPPVFPRLRAGAVCLFAQDVSARV